VPRWEFAVDSNTNVLLEILYRWNLAFFEHLRTQLRVLVGTEPLWILSEIFVEHIRCELRPMQEEERKRLTRVVERLQSTVEETVNVRNGMDLHHNRSRLVGTRNNVCHVVAAGNALFLLKGNGNSTKELVYILQQAGAGGGMPSFC
jgi:hypothetical protein